MSKIRLMRIVSDEAGAVLVEATVLLPILVVFMLGAVGFAFAFFQNSAASKAVEVGTRLAAVSDPVATGLDTLGLNAIKLGVDAPDPMPPFTVTCDGSTSTCNCTDTTTYPVCAGANITYNPDAMKTIVYGRDGLNKCGDAKSYYYAGMCDFFVNIGLANVKIKYQQTGLGYAGRPSGPIPTVVVSLQNLPFQYFFAQFTLTSTMSITGEALSSAAVTFP